jgi:nitrate reductase assembly molybdenum cofactor insertion protein NarJ
MIDLHGVYRHFGRAPNGKELPDYLPLMAEFLSLTAGSRGDAVRTEFLREYFLPFLPPMRKRLEQLDTRYRHLLDALAGLVRHELKIHEEAATHAG